MISDELVPAPDNINTQFYSINCVLMLHGAGTAQGHQDGQICFELALGL